MTEDYFDRLKGMCKAEEKRLETLQGERVKMEESINILRQKKRITEEALSQLKDQFEKEYTHLCKR